MLLNETRIGLKKLTTEQIQWCNNHILVPGRKQSNVNEHDFADFKRKKWDVTPDGKIKVKGDFLIHAVSGPVKTLDLNDTELALEEIPVQFDKVDNFIYVDIYGPKLKTLKGAPWAEGHYNLRIMRYFDHEAEWVYELLNKKKKTDPNLWEGYLIYPKNLNIKELRLLFTDNKVSHHEGTGNTEERLATRLTSTLLHSGNVSDLGKQYLESGLTFDEFIHIKRGTIQGEKFGI
jgi:hypothetical protein